MKYAQIFHAEFVIIPLAGPKPLFAHSHQGWFAGIKAIAHANNYAGGVILDAKAHINTWSGLSDLQGL